MENKTFTLKWSTITHHEATVEAKDHLDAHVKFWDGEAESEVDFPQDGIHGSLRVTEDKQ